MSTAQDSRLALRTHILELAPLQGRRGTAQAASIVAVIVIGSLIDAAGTPAAQLLASLLAWGLLLWLLWLQTPAWRFTLIVATLFALLAEMLFSLGFGLWDYRFHNVPPYVPPGHTLLFMLGLRLTRSLPDASVPTLVSGIFIGGIALTLSGISTFDGLMAALFVPVLLLGRQRKTYALMVLLSLALELLGTALGNWRWSPIVPGLGLSAHNPPLLAGVGYALFDIGVMALSRRVHRYQGDVPAVVTTTN